MIQGKKFISPGAWFTMVYPSDWNEFEDGEGSFLFYNPDTWTGNFRISAFKADAATRGAMDYGKEAVPPVRAVSSVVLRNIFAWL